jgi:hypothetical protein
MRFSSAYTAAQVMNKITPRPVFRDSRFGLVKLPRRRPFHLDRGGDRRRCKCDGENCPHA